jgi:phosphate acetyltransferase
MPDTAELAKPVAHEKYERVIKAAQTQATVKVAVAHPCDDVSLEGAVEAARLRLIDPILVGPQERIRACATRAGLGSRHFPGAAEDAGGFSAEGFRASAQ